MSGKVEQLKQRAEQLCQSADLTNEHIDAINDAALQLRFDDAPFAMRLSAKAIQLTTRNDYSRGRALALHNLGWCRISIDQYKEAEEAFAESRRISLDLRDDAALAVAQNGLGMAKRYLGDYEAALILHQSALRLREKLNDSAGVASVLLNFSGIHWRLSDYVQSLEYVYRALPIASGSKTFVLLACAYYDLGDLLWRVGEAAEAIQYSKLALALLEKHPDRQGESMALGNLGAAHHSRGEHERALDNYQRAVAIAQAAGNIETQAEVAVRMGNIYCETNNAEQGIAHLWKALQLSQQIGSRFHESQALLGLGNVQRQTGDLRASIQLLERALEISQELKMKEISSKAHLALSEAFEAENKPGAALFHHKAFHRLWQEVQGGQAAPRIQRYLQHNQFPRSLEDKLGVLPLQASGIEDENPKSLREAEALLPARKLHEVIEFVAANPEQNLTLAELAEMAALSTRQLQRAFKRVTGTTPHQFLLEQRLKRAVELLQTTKLPLVEVALSCGFSNQSHLTVHLRLATGKTPAQLRRLR